MAISDRSAKVQLALVLSLTAWLSLGAQQADSDSAFRSYRQASDSVVGLVRRAYDAADQDTEAGYREAIAHLQLATSLAPQLGDPQQEGMILLSIGQVYASLGIHDEAVASYSAAESLTAGPDQDWGVRAGLLHLKGVSFREEGKLDSSILYLSEAARVWELNGASPAATKSELASTYRRAGEHALAVQELEAVMATEEDNRASTLNLLGVLQVDVGDTDSAIVLYRRALELLPDDAHRMHAAVLNNLAVAMDALPDSVLPLLKESLALKRLAGDGAGAADVLLNIGRHYLYAGDVDSAASYIMAAQRIAEGSRSAALAHVLQAIGETFGRIRWTDSALRYLKDALALTRVHGLASTEYSILADIGFLHYYQQPNPRTALAYFDTASAVLLSNRRKVRGDDARRGFLDKNTTMFDLWVKAWLRSDSADKEWRALGAAESGRAQGVFDFLNRHSPGSVDSLEAQRLPPYTWLPEDVAVLYYWLSSDTTYVWLIARDTVTVTQIAIGKDSIAGMVRAVRSSIGVDNGTLTARVRGSGRRSTPRLLDTVVVRRLAEVVLPARLQALVREMKRLIVVPHEALAAVPFAILPLTSGSLLGEVMALQTVPALSLVTATEIRRTFDGGVQALIVGNPRMPLTEVRGTSIDQFGELPGAEREAKVVGQLLGSSFLTGVAASETTVRERLSSARIMHFATHGFAFGSMARARESFLVFASDSVNDGLLTAGEVLDDPTIRLDAELVVLSACQTGLGGVSSMEGVVGIQRAFLAKGAEALMVSLWNVSDEATTILMQSFYTHWLRDLDKPSKAEALRRAQADVRGIPGFESPAYWAPFQLVTGN